MAYINIPFYIFLIVVLILYYAVPAGYRWYVLLAASIGFYIAWGGVRMLLILMLVIALSYTAARVVAEKKKKLVFAIFICAVMAPLILTKHCGGSASIAPIGISFFSLQAVSYVADVYKDKVKVQKNLSKYALFMMFFPQIVQGPIPRYEWLGGQLYEGQRFDEYKFTKGLQLIVWGLFLKFMIADKTAVVVNTIYGNWQEYQGLYVLIVGILYSIQLYTDFLACVCMAKGMAGLFGIELSDNFNCAYRAVSVRDFWQRWHISLSTWLRDYIYIPLGGNKKGKRRKYINLLITFIVSGMWHGRGIKYVFWGLMHAFYEIVAEILNPVRNGIYKAFGIGQGSFLESVIKKTGTFFWVMLAWIIFRADGILMGIKMILNMFGCFNIWILFDDSLLTLGLDWKDWIVLLFAIMILGGVERIQTRSICIRDLILEQHIFVRWLVYIMAVMAIWVFGTYGYGFDTQDFIYGGF